MDNNDKLAQLEAVIAETRELLDELERSAKKLKEKRQHEVIDQIDYMLPETELKFGDFGPFKEEVVAEWREFIEKVKHYL